MGPRCQCAFDAHIATGNYPVDRCCWHACDKLCIAGNGDVAACLAIVIGVDEHIADGRLLTPIVVIGGEDSLSGEPYLARRNGPVPISFVTLPASSKLPGASTGDA